MKLLLEERRNADAREPLAVAGAGTIGNAPEHVVDLLGGAELQTGRRIFPGGFADRARHRIRRDGRCRILAHLARAGGRGDEGKSHRYE